MPNPIQIREFELLLKVFSKNSYTGKGWGFVFNILFFSNLIMHCCNKLLLAMNLLFLVVRCTNISLTMLPLYKYAQLERLGSIFVEIHLHDAFLPDSFTLLLNCYPVNQDHRNEYSHLL